MQDKYDQLVKDHLRQLPSEKYIFEVTKCCNYSTLVMVNKGCSLLSLYEEVSNWFECRHMKSLYILSEDGNKILIPPTSVVSLKDYIKSNPSKFVPIYPIPNWVVYRIYLDDGHDHCHTEECTPQK